MRTVATRPSPARPGARRLGALAALALVSVLAAACGDDGDDGSDGGDSGATVLSDDQLQTASITLDNLGPGWAEEPVEDDDDSPAPGCLGDAEAVTDGVDPDAEVKKSFAYGEQGLPGLETGVQTYGDEDEITDVFEEVQAVYAECTSVVGTDDEGNSFDLTLSTNEDPSSEGVDDQINVTATGTFTSPEGQTVEVSLHQTAVRIDNNIATIGTTAFTDATAAHATYAQIGIDRLVAVVAGEEPPATTAPAPA